MSTTNGKLSNIPKLSAADRKKLGLTGPAGNQVGSKPRAATVTATNPKNGKPKKDWLGQTKEARRNNLERLELAREVVGERQKQVAQTYDEWSVTAGAIGKGSGPTEGYRDTPAPVTRKPNEKDEWSY